MHTHCRVLIALVSAWLAVTALITRAPRAAGLRKVRTANQSHVGILNPKLRDTPSFMHNILYW